MNVEQSSIKSTMTMNGFELLRQLLRTIERLDNQLTDVASRLEKVENDVKARIRIPCPAEGCTRAFNSNPHRNRHIKDWIKSKSHLEPLWKEHRDAAERLKLKDDQVTEMDPDDLPQQTPVECPQADPTMRSGPSSLGVTPVDHLETHPIHYLPHQLDFPIPMDPEFIDFLSRFDPSFGARELDPQNPALFENSVAFDFNDFNNLSTEEIDDLIRDLDSPNPALSDNSVAFDFNDFDILGAEEIDNLIRDFKRPK